MTTHVVPVIMSHMVVKCLFEIVILCRSIACKHCIVVHIPARGESNVHHAL